MDCGGGLEDRKKGAGVSTKLEVVIGGVYRHKEKRYTLQLIAADSCGDCTCAGVDDQRREIRRGFVLFWKGTFKEFCEQFERLDKETTVEV